MEDAIITTKDMVLRRVAEHYPNEIAFILRACEFADTVMKDVPRRGNGQPYSTHYYSAAYMRAERGYGTPVDVATMICHDSMEDGKITYNGRSRPVRENDIIRALSNGGTTSRMAKKVAKRVEALTNFKRSKFGEDRIRTRAANFLKATELFVKDINVIPDRLHDRYHNMLTLGDKPGREKQLETSLDTLEVFCPFGKSLGMYDIATRMEDIAFSFIMPREYAATKEELDRRLRETAQTTRELVAIYSKLLGEKGIPHSIELGNISLYFLYQALEKNGWNSHRVHNLRVINPIILSSDQEMCFDTTRIIKRHGNVSRGFENDYISSPRDNFYQADHTVVHERNTGAIYQLQVCTYLMSQVNKYGLPAYLALREHHPSQKNFDRVIQTKIEAIKDILMARDENGESYNLSEHLNNEIFGNTITVYTPDNMPIVLPRHSVPHDFAFRVSKKLGQTVDSALINGMPVEGKAGLITELQDGDCVVIRSKPSANASPELLGQVLKKVKTESARSGISSLMNKSA